MKKLLLIIVKIINIPFLIVMGVIDSTFAKRMTEGRLLRSDYLPHLFVISACILFYILNKNGTLDLPNLLNKDMLEIILNFEGIIFGTTLAISTFLLSILKPSKLISQYPDKEKDIEDIMDDLQLTNAVIFTVLLFTFVIWSLMSLELLSESSLLTIFTFCMLLWSLLGVSRLIKGVFLLVKIEDL